VFGVKLAIGHHLRQRHHRGGVRSDGIGGDDVDVGLLWRLCRSDAAIHADCFLFVLYDWGPVVFSFPPFRRTSASSRYLFAEAAAYLATAWLAGRAAPA